MDVLRQRRLLAFDPKAGGPLYRFTRIAEEQLAQKAQNLSAPAILRMVERGRKRVLSAPALLSAPVMATARLASSPARPWRTTSSARIEYRSKRLSWPKPATSPNSVLVGPGHKAETLTPNGFVSSCSASVKDKT